LIHWYLYRFPGKNPPELARHELDQLSSEG
jgi:hypothetical protein